MKKQQNLFLIGLMGAGKTTIGRSVAQALHRDFYDSDQAIEDRTGVNVAWIFDVEGEEGFREREAQAIDELTQMQGIVLATGGGAILRPENRQALASRGVVVYLTSTVQNQLMRLSKDKRRPLLQSKDKRKVLEKMITQRDALYREIADYAISTDDGSIKQVTDEILACVARD